MNWILEHLNIVFIVGGAVAWWFNQRGKKAEDENAPPQQEATFEDPDLAERTRRIREEIQRKIEQRARGNQPPAPVRPEYREPPPLVALEPPVQPLRPAMSRGFSRAETERQAEILEQQAAMAERLRAAQEMKRAAQQRAAFETKAAMQIQGEGRAVRQKTRSVLVEELRDPAALRRAFVLREIIGPPVALR